MFLFLLLYYVYNDTIYHTMYALYNIKRNVLLYIKYPVQYTPCINHPTFIFFHISHFCVTLVTELGTNLVGIVVCYITPKNLELIGNMV